MDKRELSQIVLEESLTLLEGQETKLVAYFYAGLFIRDPNLRELFPLTMDVQRDRLLAAIVTAVRNFKDEDAFSRYLKGLGRDHKKFYTKPWHYDIVGEALLNALIVFGGPSWTREYTRVWADAYGEIARIMIEGAEEDDNPAIWYAEVLTHERRGRNHDIAVFTCRPVAPSGPDGMPAPLTYEAGQYLSVECSYQPRLWRPLSPANAPSSANPRMFPLASDIEFHVRALPGGLVSSALVHDVKPRDIIKLAAPMGESTLDPNSDRDVLLVAGGTGLAPMTALLEQLTRFNRTRRVLLFVGALYKEDLYHLRPLSDLAARYPWLTVVPACSEDPTWRPGERDYEFGNVSDVIARHADSTWKDFDVFVSGSPEMVNATLNTLADLRVPSTRIKYDAFGT